MDCCSLKEHLELIQKVESHRASRVAPTVGSALERAHVSHDVTTSPGARRPRALCGSVVDLVRDIQREADGKERHSTGGFQ